MMNDAFDLLGKLLETMTNDDECDCTQKTKTKLELEREADLACSYVRDFTMKLLSIISTDTTHDRDAIYGRANAEHNKFKKIVFDDDALRMGTTFSVIHLTKEITSDMLCWYCALWSAFRDEMESV